MDNSQKGALRTARPASGKEPRRSQQGIAMFAKHRGDLTSPASRIFVRPQGGCEIGLILGGHYHSFTIGSGAV
jgi:hypothetical protein